jgi:hypothetical protein
MTLEECVRYALDEPVDQAAPDRSGRSPGQ